MPFILTFISDLEESQDNLVICLILRTLLKEEQTEMVKTDDCAISSPISDNIYILTRAFNLLTKGVAI